MKALVTGATGFIGSTLIEELTTRGFEVYALMRSSSKTHNLEGLKYERREGSLTDLPALKQAVRGMDYVFHLAGVVAASTKEGYFSSNARGTQLLAQAVAEECPNLSRFIYVSSLAAGGPASSLEPRTESDQPKPVSAYGESKLQGEKELLQFADRFPVTIIRPPMVYGPKDQATFIFFKSVARNLVPLVKGSTPDGRKYYSVIHVKDLCRGIAQAAVAPGNQAASGEVFYLSADGTMSLDQWMDVIAEQMRREPFRIRVHPSVLRIAAAGLTVLGRLTNRSFPLNLDKMNEILPDYWICSNEKAKRVLGFLPEFDLKSGVANTVEWYRSQRWI